MWRFSCKLLLSEHTITKDTQQPLDIAVLLHATLQLIIPHVKLHEHSVNQHNNMHRAVTCWHDEY